MRSLFTEHFIEKQYTNFAQTLVDSTLYHLTWALWVQQIESLHSREAQPASTSCSSDEQWLWTTLRFSVRMRLARLDVSQASQHGQNQVQGTQAQSETSLPMVPRAATMQHRVTLGKQPTSTPPWAYSLQRRCGNRKYSSKSLYFNGYFIRRRDAKIILWLVDVLMCKTKHPHPVRPGQDHRPNCLMWRSEQFLQALMFCGG